jgi:hypothetical protein
MAEVVAIVASGISIAQIAGSVASSVAKINDYWNQIKAAPNDIKHLLREIDSLSLILRHIQDDFTRSALPDVVFDNSCTWRTLELCQSCAIKLEELVNKLAEDIEGKTKLRKRFGSLRAVLKNGDIKGLKRRLKNA